MTTETPSLDQLHVSNCNVRAKKRLHRIDELAADIKENGLINPILIREEDDGYGVLAGQRRFAALQALKKEGIDVELRFTVLDVDDGKARAISLSENVQVDGMTPIDRWKAFTALVRDGLDVEQIASIYSLPKKRVEQTLLLGNLPAGILTAYEKEDITGNMLELLAVATKSQRTEWVKLYKQGEAPLHPHYLKQWLFNGETDYETKVAIFDVPESGLALVPDLFQEKVLFADSEAFLVRQRQAIDLAKEDLLGSGWSGVEIVDGYFRDWEYVKTKKADGGKVYIVWKDDGSVKFQKGFLDKKSLKRNHNSSSSGSDKTQASARNEISISAQEYIRNYLVQAGRSAMLDNPDKSLRVLLAMLLSGSEGSVRLVSDHQFEAVSETEGVGELLNTTAYQKWVAQVDVGLSASGHARDGLGCAFQSDFSATFGLLDEMDDDSLSLFITALTSSLMTQHGEAAMYMAGQLGNPATDIWDASQGKVLFSKIRSKAVLLAMLAELTDEDTAQSHAKDTLVVLREVVADCAKSKPEWTPRYFFGQTYTEGQELSFITGLNKHKS